MRYAAITNNRNHLDHLAPLCHMLKMPLIVPQQKIADLANKYYPQIQVHILDYVHFAPPHLAKNYDVLFLSGKFWINWLHAFTDLLTTKQLRFVYCPHGNSDKLYGYQHLDRLYRHDMHLIYGEQMQKHLRDNHLLHHIQSTAIVGNYRYLFYQKFQTQFDALTQNEIFSQFKKKQTTIFYAPTWNDLDNSSTFLDSYQGLLDTLPCEYNLLIKLHPLIERYYPAHAYYLIENTKHMPNVVTLLHEPIIYPIMQKCDVYVGDYSSVGYDFLTFKKPMFFLGHPELSAPLHQCGVRVQNNLFATIKQSLHLDFCKQQSKLYDYAFAKKATLSSIANQIQDALSRKP